MKVSGTDSNRASTSTLTSDKWSMISATVVATVVFLGDLWVPLGIAGGVLYLIVILLALPLNARVVYAYAVLCTTLTAIGYLVSLPEGDVFADFANRVVAVLAIWIVAVLGLHRRRLFESIFRHQQIIDQVQEAVITADMDGIIDYWNRGAESIFGYPAAEMIGASISNIYQSGEPEATVDEVMDRLVADGSAETETTGVSREGNEITIRQWLLLRRDDTGQPSGVILQISDVTRRREQERAATRMEAFYQTILDELPLQVAIFDPSGRFLYLNPASLSDPDKRLWILGHTEQEYFESVGRNLELVGQRDSYRRLAMKDRSKTTFEEVFTTRDGDRRSFLHGFVPVLDNGGRVTKVLGYRYDITEQKQATWAFQESLARLKAIVDAAGDGIFTVDSTGCIESCNQASQRLFGFEPGEAIGLPIDGLIGGLNGQSDLRFHEGHLVQITSSNAPGIGEFEATRKDGTTFPVEVATSMLSLKDGPLYTAIIRDLTNRKNAERALMRYNERLEAFRQMDEAILTASSTTAVAQVAADHLGRLVPAGTVCIALFDDTEETSDVLTIQCQGGEARQSSVKTREFLHVEDGLEIDDRVSRASREGFLTIATQEDSGGRDRPSQVAVPLVVQNAIIGMLRLQANSGAYFEDEDIDIAIEVSGILAIAIQDARLFEETLASRKRLQALSHRLVAVQEHERRLIARELHDEIGQALTGLKFSLETLETDSSRNNLEQIEDARQVTQQLLARVRDMSLDLRPAMLDDLGLLPALLWLTDRYSRRTGLEVQFRHSGLEKRLDSEIETAAYRIVQEALTNVARHAGQNVGAEVFVLASDGSLIVRVQDDGVGFDVPDVVKKRNSTGISGMEERATLLGGSFTIESKPGRGTVVSSELPLVVQETAGVMP